MDHASRLEIFKRALRRKFAVVSATPNIPGLQAYCDALTDGEASDSVLIKSMSFEGEQASGDIVLEPLERLSAALDVLAEVDPDNTPAPRPAYDLARFSTGGFA